MTSPAPQRRPRSASPADRSAEYAAHQQKLKDEAAERRRRAEVSPAKPRPRPARARG